MTNSYRHMTSPDSCHNISRHIQDFVEEETFGRCIDDERTLFYIQNWQLTIL